VRQSRPSAPRRQGNPFDSCLIISRNAEVLPSTHRTASALSIWPAIASEVKSGVSAGEGSKLGRTLARWEASIPLVWQFGSKGRFRFHAAVWPKADRGTMRSCEAALFSRPS
jgi:hypothetical protein